METKARILLVEDNKEVWETYKYHLEKAGYAVDIVESKKEAFGKIRTKIYDVALVDLQLKDDITHKGGVDVLEFIEQMEEGTKAFAVSATQIVSDAVASWRKGIVDFLMKESIRSSKDLIDPIERALKDHRRASLGDYESLMSYLAAPNITPIWESDVKDTLGCTFETMQKLFWKCLSPLRPLLRKKDMSPSFALDKDRRAVNGLFWSKEEGSAIWVTIASLEMNLIAPLEEISVERIRETHVRETYGAVWKVRVPRDDFLETVRDIPSTSKNSRR